MRADRLLSLALLLQARGRMTAQQLAQELEVSLRTIYRDIDALSSAGVPIYADRGPGGGYTLLDGYRTELTGLSEDEVRALFMLSIPGILAQLGVGPQLKAALRKLSAALPGDRRADEAWVRQRVHLDWTVDPDGQDEVPHLRTVQRGVWEDRELRVSYRVLYGSYDRSFERLVDPLGLVAHGGIWHLVCQTKGQIRVYRVSQLVGVELTQHHFERPPDLDLAGLWRSWHARSRTGRPEYAVTARVSPEMLAQLPQYLGEAARSPGMEGLPPNADGRFTVQLRFRSLQDARARILGLGGAIEVLSPVSLRFTVADFAQQAAKVYKE